MLFKICWEKWQVIENVIVLLPRSFHFNLDPINLIFWQILFLLPSVRLWSIFWHFFSQGCGGKCALWKALWRFGLFQSECAWMRVLWTPIDYFQGRPKWCFKDSKCPLDHCYSMYQLWTAVKPALAWKVMDSHLKLRLLILIRSIHRYICRNLFTA